MRRKRKDETRRRPIISSLSQSPSFYGREWAKLTKEEKLQYRNKANGRSRLQLNSCHIASAPHVAQSGDSVKDDDLERDMRNADDIEVENTTDAFLGFDRERAATRNVVVAASNVMVKTIEGKFLPMELGLVTYSLAKGVCTTFHRLKETHCISLSNFDEAIGQWDKEREFAGMLDEVCTVIGDSQFQYQGKRCVLIFTREEMMEQLKGSLRHYIETAGHAALEIMWAEGRLRVADIGYLIARLYCAAGISMHPVLCADITSGRTADWTEGSCKYHMDNDNNYCALGVCKRWCYLISDSLLEAYDSNAVERKLMPVSTQSRVHVQEAVSDGQMADSAAAVPPLSLFAARRGPYGQPARPLGVSRERCTRRSGGRRGRKSHSHSGP